MSHVTFPGVSYSPRHSYGTVPYGRKRKAGRSSQRQQRLIPSRDAPSRSLSPELRPPGSEERARFVSISWFAGPWHVDGQGGRETDPRGCCCFVPGGGLAGHLRSASDECSPGAEASLASPARQSMAAARGADGGRCVNGGGVEGWRGRSASFVGFGRVE